MDAQPYPHPKVPNSLNCAEIWLKHLPCSLLQLRNPVRAQLPPTPAVLAGEQTDQQQGQVSFATIEELGTLCWGGNMLLPIKCHCTVDWKDAVKTEVSSNRIK